MQEVGFACSADEASFRGVLQQCGGQLSEQAVAEVLSMMAQTQQAANYQGGDQLSLANTLAIIANGGAAPGADGSAQTGWNWKVVLDVIKRQAQNLQWERIAELLDHPGFSVPDQQGFVLLVSAYKYGAGEQLPVKSVVGRVWGCHGGQLSFLRHAVSAGPELFSFQGSERKLAPVEGLHGGKSPVGTPNQAWLSIDLLQVLCYLVVEPSHQPVVREILETPVKHCPEVLLLTMAAVPPMEWSLLQREVFSVLLPLYLANNQANTQVVLHRLWAVNSNLLLEALVEYYAQDAANLMRVLDICQELKALPKVLDSTPYAFSLELAALAGWRQYLNLEKWAAEHMQRDSMQFVTALLAFLDLRTAPDQPPGKPRLHEDSMRGYLRALAPMRGQMAGDLGAAAKKVSEQVAKMYPGLAPLVAGTESFASDVEEEANSHFQKIYSEARPLEDVVGMLRGFKVSANPREQEVFACMIHNLFDEYRFFPRYPDKELHITALLFGSLVAHGLVSSITLGIALRYVLDALRKAPGTKMFSFGADALRQFAHIAYNWPQFVAHVLAVPHLRQGDPELAGRMEAIAREHQVPLPPAADGAASASGGGAGEGAGGVDALMGGLGGDGDGGAGSKAGGGADGGYRPWLPAGGAGAGAAGAGSGGASGGGAGGGGGGPGRASGAPLSIDAEMEDQAGRVLADEVAASSLAPATGGGAGSKAPTLASMVNTESLETAAEKADTFRKPPEGVQDRVHFLINNLSEDNVEQRAAEIKAKVLPEFIDWFASYLVVKRAAQEANYHELYTKLVDRMGDKELMRILVRTTHYYVRILLYSERIVKESNDRALLKNLGTWLGLLTFARNRPVLSKELELKGVIVEAYQRGRLIAVLPFINKLLECCKGTKVFTSCNPMVAGILSLLAELHGIKGLKINNVFSIELLFKAFNLGVAEVKPTDLLRHLPRERLQNQDWSVDALPAEPTPAAASTAQAMQAGAQAQAAADASKGMQGPGVPGLPPGLPPGVAAAMSAQQQQGQQGAGHGSLPPGMRAGPGGTLMPADAAAAAAKANMEAAAAAAAQGGMQGGMAPQAGTAAAAMAAAGLEATGLAAQLHTYAIINPSLGGIAERLALKRHVPTAVDRAIYEILSPVVERSVTIACYTTVELLLKDFALDPDENRMRKAAHLMVSSLAGSLALVTCKDPLRVSLANNLRNLMAPHAGGLEAGVLDSVANVVVQDNLDLGCTIIERAATDKAVRDVDKLLSGAYEERAKARAQGKPYADASAFHGRFPRDLPESLRPRPGVVSPLQLRVYEDFARIPRTAPPPTPGEGGVGKAEGGAGGVLGGMGASAASASFLEKYLLWQGQADAAVGKAEGAAPGGSEQAELAGLLAELVEAVGAAPVPEDAAAFFIHRIMRHLFEAGASSPLGKLGANFYVTCLRHLVEGLPSKGAGVSLGPVWGALDDDRKFGAREAVEALLRTRLLPAPEVDGAVAKALVGGRGPPSSAALDLASHLAKACVLRDQSLSYGDLAGALEAMAKVALGARGLAMTQGGAGAQAAVAAADAQLALVEQARKLGALALVPNRPAGEVPPGVRNDKGDPAGLKDQALGLFEEWLRLANASPGAVVAALSPAAPGASEADKAAVGQLLGAVRASGMLNDEGLLERYVRVWVDVAAAHALSGAGAEQGGVGGSSHLQSMAVDALARLLVVLAVHGGGEPFLSRALTAVVGVIKREADERTVAFNGRPHLRLLVGIMCELPGGGGSGASTSAAPLDPNMEALGLRCLRAVALALHSLQPLSVPGFAFCWLEALAHRAFMPRLLHAPQAGGWALCEALLVALLAFLEPHLRAADLPESMRALYKGALRLLLVLLHDFPEFLCEHHFALCAAIPPSCVQMRNLILSAFPRNMRLPDPFTPHLKVDLLPEISTPPRLLPELERLLPEGLRVQVDAYLRGRTPASLPAELCKLLVLSPVEAKVVGTSVNTKLCNQVVLYVGASARAPTSPAHAAAMDIFLRLVADGGDAELRYAALNAIANQLRYPNAHTHYFSCVLLTLFAEVKSEAVKEQVTRVLLERLIVNRPHPWGLLITFIELIKNPRYNFWAHEFTRCAPDIERLFKSVASSCMGPGAGAGGQGGLGGPPGTSLKDGGDEGGGAGGGKDGPAGARA